MNLGKEAMSIPAKTASRMNIKEYENRMWLASPTLGSVRNTPRCELRKLNKEIKVFPIRAKQARFLHPPIAERCRRQMLSISSNLHPELIPPKFNQILMGIVFVLKDYLHSRHLHNHSCHGEKREKQQPFHPGPRWRQLVAHVREIDGHVMFGINTSR